MTFNVDVKFICNTDVECESEADILPLIKRELKENGATTFLTKFPIRRVEIERTSPGKELTKYDGP